MGRGRFCILALFDIKIRLLNLIALRFAFLFTKDNQFT